MNSTYLAAVVSALVVVVMAPGTIRFLQRVKAGQPIREDGPAAHQSKAGTPTMGGVLLVAGIAVGTLLLATPGSASAGVLLIATVGYGLIGLWDDLMKVVKTRSLGIKARVKLVLQLAIAIFIAVYAYESRQPNLHVIIPFTEHVLALPAPLFFLLAIGTVVGTSNAVNITDGLDGLAAGSVCITAIVSAVLAWKLDAPDVAVFLAAVAGACAAFVWFNARPARVFMGDTGSMALGAALGGAAVLTGTELLLFVAGGLFVAETLSVMLQVAYFRRTGGKRLFRMSPLHHHFELVGWQETQIVTRFWLVAALCGSIALIAMP